MHEKNDSVLSFGAKYEVKLIPLKSSSDIVSIFVGKLIFY